MLRFRILLATFAAICSASPVHAQICTPFIDVPASDPFCSNIQWMLNRGVTFGCTANQYCPANPVRRDQMAAFMFRLSHDVVFQDGGNAFGSPAVLGTTDNQPVDIRANGARVMRYEPNAVSPNVIGGSAANSVTAGVRGATIAGGGVPAGNTDPTFFQEAPNRATDVYGTVGGGYGNRVGDDAGSVTDAPFATVAGGVLNTASGDSSTVSGGLSNVASGVGSTVAGGGENAASARFSFAAGRTALADQEQCFVFANWRGFQSGSCLGVPNIARFLLNHGLSVDYSTRLANGGGTRWVYIGDVNANRTIDTWTGAHLSNTGVWTNSSDRALKDGFTMVDTQSILEGVVKLPVTRWHYRHDGPGVEHIGPTAQDFQAAFGLGHGATGIGTVDVDGVALAAIQGLNAKLEARSAARDAEIASLRAELAEIRSLLANGPLHNDAVSRYLRRRPEYRPRFTVQLTPSRSRTPPRRGA